MTINLRSKGLILILSSPSGGGKSSLCRALLANDNNLCLSISATTRARRPLEQEGIHYYFKSLEEFEDLIKQRHLLEYAKIYDNYYGTPQKNVDIALQKGMDVLFDIDSEGAKSIKEKRKEETVSIFILPPSFDILRQRLTHRNQDSKEAIEMRLSSAYTESMQLKEYDYVVVNEDFATALNVIHSILIAERAKKFRLDKLDNFLKYDTIKK